MNNKKPLLRGHFHQSMFFIAVGACSLLILKANSKAETISCIVYTLGLLCMLGVSALYHRIYWSPSKRLLMKRIDHAAIYVMIAGTATPVSVLVLPDPTGPNFLKLIWLVAFIGIIQAIFFVHLPKMVSSIIYVIMGFLVAPYFSQLATSLGTWRLSLLIGGGVVYSLGAIGYGLKRPVLNPKVFGYHEFFHVLVSLGVIIHFMLIYSIIGLNTYS